MRIGMLIVVLSMAGHGLFAQPPENDDCMGVIDLGRAPYCPDSSDPVNTAAIFSNSHATASSIGAGNNPTCFNGGTVQRDVWFAFTTSDTIIDYTITVTGVPGPAGEPALLNPQVALYRGVCAVNSLAELLCASASPGQNRVVLQAEGLTPNITYFLRINDFSETATSPAGSFSICIDKRNPIHLISEGSSTACSGLLYDAGGPDGDYSNNENHTFTICPTPPSACINFTLSYFNIEYNDFATTDQLLFYDGAAALPGNLITAIGGIDYASASSGVCFAVQATSGCLTVQFVSDGSATFDGFAGSWTCSAVPCVVNSPISVDATASAQAIITALSTPQTQATITHIDCGAGAYGTFAAGDNTDLGLRQGLLLTTGELRYAPGPNFSPGDGNIFTADLGSPGDVDLDTLSTLFGNGTRSQDACVIELDVFANTNELAFEYIFGSEEYPEFANDDYNDIFAFLISGPGIAGLPALNNQLNIATLPGTNTFVEINSVNNLNNWEYYRNNEVGLSLQYDGLTADFLGVKKSLTARATVTPCQTYHLKLAIADRFDGIYDSGVFIAELRGGTPEIAVNFNSGVDYLIEGCTDQPDEIVFRMDNPPGAAVAYNVVLGGTATLGLDYTLALPPQLTFAPGTNEIVFPVSVLTDLNDQEGTETVTIMLTRDFGCGLVILAELEIELRDRLRVDINTGQDTVRLCMNTRTELVVEGATTYFWTPVSVFDNPTSSTPLATPAEDGWVYVVGQVGPGCVATDSIYLLQATPRVTIATAATALCRGQSISLSAETNTNGEGLTWSPDDGSLSATTGLTVEASPSVSTYYFADVQVNGCAVKDSVYIQVDSLPQLLTITADPAENRYCQGERVVLSSPAYDPAHYANIMHTWSGIGLETADSLYNIILTATDTFTYQRMTTNGGCVAVAEVTLHVITAEGITIQPRDPLICLGESIDLVVNSTAGGTISWSPATALSCADCFAPTASPMVTTVYSPSITIEGCTFLPMVSVRVNSPPSIQLIDNQAICSGDTVQLNLAVPAAGVDYFWTSLQDPNFSSNDPGLRISPNESDTYTLTASNDCGAAMEQTATLFVNTPPAGLTIAAVPVLTGTHPTVDLAADVADGGGSGTFEWTLAGVLIGTNTPLVGYQPAAANLPAYAVVTYRNACGVLTDSVLLQLLDYRIPTIFSPNGDGVNDVFKPFIQGTVDQLTMEIYNRWGQLVFATNDPANFGWDGLYKGQPAPADVYLYHIRLGITGENLTTSGQVTLVR
ncbi:MAG: hypothetical protein DA408_05155 [Bacteroidetes bacterium]|nr:MAG: hypothetical protein C7N36_12515 [Bacteroidota bacterium]PTM13846.1 MAG: hypothetical protein DA408_05155 [Bacteroidota bacterium]